MTDETGLVERALVASLAQLTVVEPANRADMGTYSYRYADLGDIVKLTRPVLAEHGLTAVQSICAHDGGLAVVTSLIHESGNRMTFGPLPFPHGRDAQATGSMITYHRRYALLAALGMATGEDDDGAKAVPAEVQRTPGLRTSVLQALEKLGELDRTWLRAWCEENGIPIVPAQMTEGQCAAVIDRIMHLDDEAIGGQEA